MNILFLTMNNFEDIEEHSIYPDLICNLQEKGNRVTVVLPREKKYGDGTSCIEKSGIKIIKVRTGNLFDVSMKTKLLSRSLLCHQYKSALKRFASKEKYDLVLSSTPPTILYPMIKKIKERDGAYTYLMLKDIFPQNAVDLGMIKGEGLIHKILRIFEKNLYKSSDTIGCMSPANVEYLLSQDPWIDENKVTLCPNALKVYPIRCVDRDSVRRKYGIPEDKVIFIYGGGIGRPQGIGFFEECIKQIGTSDQFMFVVIGSGPYINELRELSETHRNLLRVIAWLPMDAFNDVVSASDVGLIFLDHRFKIPNFPSRLLAYMQAGLPVAAATDVSSDVGKIAQGNGFGFWCESNNVKDFIKIIEKFCDEQTRKAMGKKSRSYFEKYYNVEQVSEAILERAGNCSENRTN